jgi:hypothetical protein
MPETLEMSDLFQPDDVAGLRNLLEQSATPAEALKTWRDAKENNT